jgi:flagellar assembly factor FliW
VNYRLAYALGFHPWEDLADHEPFASTLLELVAREENGAFQWLHSLDDPSLAIPVTNPFVFFQSYEVEISSAEADRIGITEPEQADVYVTVRAGEQLEDFRANLRAPILISAGRGFQVINESSDAPVRAPLFDQVALEQVA